MDSVITALTAPPVLAFVLAALASALLRADLRLPESAYTALTTYLLLAIGIKGGHAAAASPPQDLWALIAAGVVLGVVLTVVAYHLARVTRLPAIDRSALAAHYGSVSLVTYTTCLAVLEARDVPYPASMAALLAVMEAPGIIAGIWLATRAGNGAGMSAGSFKHIAREVLTGKSIVLLFGGLAIGLISGPVGYSNIEPFFAGLFTGALVLFLLHLGSEVGRQWRDARSTGLGLVAFALLMPIVGASAGLLASALLQIPAGTAAILATLCASASYIAAPAAVRLALPDVSVGPPLTAALLITFPFNLIVGLPLYITVAEAITN